LLGNGHAFAALGEGGHVVCWGDAAYGGNCSAAVTSVAKLYGNGRAFAAVKVDGSLFSWGSARHGGNGHINVADPVVSMANTDSAFAAQMDNGEVIVWGDPLCGGDASGMIPVGQSP